MIIPSSCSTKLENLFNPIFVFSFILDRSPFLSFFLSFFLIPFIHFSFAFYVIQSLPSLIFIHPFYYSFFLLFFLPLTNVFYIPSIISSLVY